MQFQWGQPRTGGREAGSAHGNGLRGNNGWEQHGHYKVRKSDVGVW